MLVPRLLELRELDLLLLLDGEVLREELLLLRFGVVVARGRLDVDGRREELELLVVGRCVAERLGRTVEFDRLGRVVVFARLGRVVELLRAFEVEPLLRVRDGRVEPPSISR